MGFKLGTERRERVTEAQVWRKGVPDSRCTERESTTPNGRLNKGNCKKMLVDGTKTPRRCVVSYLADLLHPHTSSRSLRSTDQRLLTTSSCCIGSQCKARRVGVMC